MSQKGSPTTSIPASQLSTGITDIADEWRLGNTAVEDHQPMPESGRKSILCLLRRGEKGFLYHGNHGDEGWCRVKRDGTRKHVSRERSRRAFGRSTE